MGKKMQPVADHERLVNAAHRLARISQDDPLKLFRLLYLLDVQRYRDTGQCCTGEAYYALADGPAPGTLRSALIMREMDLSRAIGILTATDSHLPWTFDARPFSSAELALLGELESRYGGTPAWQLALDDENAWWRVYNARGGVGAMIPYEMTLGGRKAGSISEQSQGWRKFLDRFRRRESSALGPHVSMTPAISTD